jgi:DNA-binding NarL/FixJ family response regulator
MLRGRGAEQARGMRVLRGAGIESEAELPFAGLHLLLRSELGAAGAPISGAAMLDAFADLTPQELQIPQLAAHGLSKRDIAAQLFLSPRTVAYHLYKAYPKLGIRSRGELAALGMVSA